MPASIHHQVDRALDAITWNTKEITAYKKETGVVSVKKALRPEGDPTKPLPVILGIGTRKSYYDAVGLFFIISVRIGANDGYISDACFG